MIVYHSGIYPWFPQFDELVGGTDKQPSFSWLIPYDSFLDVRGGLAKGQLRLLEKALEFHNKAKKPGSIFLDSGAFSAYHRGFILSLEAYMDFIHSFGHYFDVVCGLDVIGDPEGTWKNYCQMRDAGLENVLPVFHFKEGREVFDRLAESTDYMGVGGVAGIAGEIGGSIKEAVADKFRHLFYDQHGVSLWEGKRFHGFGIGNFDMFQMVDWHSSDASTLGIIARNGGVISIERKGRRLHLRKVQVSSRSRETAEHIMKLHPVVRQRLEVQFAQFGYKLEDFDEEKMGNNTLGLCNRAMYNVALFNHEVEEKGYEVMFPQVRTL